MSRCICGHHEEAHFAMVKEGYSLQDSACCAGHCACGRFQPDDEPPTWPDDPTHEQRKSNP